VFMRMEPPKLVDEPRELSRLSTVKGHLWTMWKTHRAMSRLCCVEPAGHNLISRDAFCTIVTSHSGHPVAFWLHGVFRIG